MLPASNFIVGMSFATLKYSCTSRLSCSNALPADVIICVPVEKVLPISGVSVGYIEGQITQVAECPKGYNCVLYTYTLYFDTDQLAEAESIDASDIQGVFCKGCLTSWIEDFINVKIAEIP